MTKIIGLTGGIGSGKTTIARQFKELGVPVYIADDEAKKITNTPKTAILIRQTFGTEIFDESKLNRNKLAEIVFSNPQKLEQLNAIIHPLVKQDFEKWLLKHANHPFIIYEAAILFESGSYKNCDKIITVTAPLETRIKRVIKRDITTYNAVVKRINNQWADEMRIAKSDFIIQNADTDNTKNQINKILAELTIL